MSKRQLLTLAALILVLLGVAMLAIGIQGKILAPPITGVGFLVIAFVFLKLR